MIGLPMTRESRGYMTSIINAVDAADGDLIGVRLGKLCIRKGISVMEVAEYLGVSRQTVYSWFTGRFSPRGPQVDKVNQLLVGLR